MKASELIQALHKAIDQYGDLVCVVYNEKESSGYEPVEQVSRDYDDRLLIA